MQQVAENYRKFGNTFRYILGNLADFDPARDALEFGDLAPLDQYMLLRTTEVSERVQRWYEEFSFHRIYHQLNEFCAVDLSNVYFDVLKDRLHTAPPSSRGRRSAQTALWRIGEALARLVAPILSFSADEVWSYLPAISGRPESVHLAYFPQAGDITGGKAGKRHAQGGVTGFDFLMTVRGEAMKKAE